MLKWKNILGGIGQRMFKTKICSNLTNLTNLTNLRLFGKKC
jgi:hypothetical protein